MEIEIIGFIILYLILSAIGLGLNDMLSKMGNGELPPEPFGKIMSCTPLVNFCWIPFQFIAIIYYYLNRNGNNITN